MKRKVKILTDSTCDLSFDDIKKLDMDAIPLYVQFGDETFLDGINIDPKSLYDKVEDLQMMPKTAAPSPGDFIKFFQTYIDQDYDIVYMGIGSTLSATYQSATVAKMEFDDDRIFLIDSKNLSSGIALLALKANDLKKQDLSAKDIKAHIDLLVPKVRSQFAIQTLDYLHKGGRASGTQALLGSMLRIKPIIKVTDGKLDVYKKAFGKMSRALDIMLDDYFKEGDQIDQDYVFITHSMADKHAVYMKEKVNETLKPKSLFEGHAGCVISSHCGAGTIGILYLLK